MFFVPPKDEIPEGLMGIDFLIFLHSFDGFLHTSFFFSILFLKKITTSIGG